MRELRHADVHFAVTVHAERLAPSFFSRLGRRYLAAYYRAFVVCRFSVALLAERDGRPVGLLVGTLRQESHHRWVVRRLGRRLALEGMRGLLLRPAVLRDFLRTRAGRYARALLRFSKPPAPAAPPSGGGDPEVAVLSHLAVLADEQGRGAGRLLVEEFLDRVARAGISHAELVTLTGPEGAQAFYERLGWSADRQSADLDGQSLTHMRIEVSEA